jgi:hypothetical protein
MKVNFLHTKGQGRGGRSQDEAAKVDVLRDSHKLLVTPYREFEQEFGGKTVLAGLRQKSS